MVVDTRQPGSPQVDLTSIDLHARGARGYEASVIQEPCG
jgi:hypothetical protein